MSDLTTLRRLQCSMSGCARTARYEALVTGREYCPDHAADLAATIVFQPIEGVAFQELKKVS